MNSVGPNSASTGDFQPELQGTSVFVDRSDQMYRYRFQNTFKGVPVSQQARNLSIDKADQLDSALQLTQSAQVWVGYISPQEADAKYRQQYQQILKQLYQGQLVIIQQDKQFCPALNKFLIMIVYTRVSYQLNPRYQHLKQEYING